MMAPSKLHWFKSSYSGGSGTECVEAALVPGGILLRDSKLPASAMMAVSGEAWARFLGDMPLRSGVADA